MYVIHFIKSKQPLRPLLQKRCEYIDLYHTKSTIHTHASTLDIICAFKSQPTIPLSALCESLLLYILATLVINSVKHLFTCAN